ncbi:MAG: beta-lactamase [Parcubacteria group bacterium Gr01-1014_3]|nr:MAG: beta-lactamase [Parcubacteria group bacterium Gr01-1014_3]
MNRMLKNCLSWVLVFISGVAFMWLIQLDSIPLAQLAQQQRGGGGGADYEFINPLLECEVGGDLVEFKELKSFKNKVVALTEKLIKVGDANHISIYFRDLNNGPWFGINEREVYAPGSLLKVPLMITAFRQEELTPGFLNKSVAYEKPLKLPKEYHQDIKPRISLETGKSYSIEELVRRAIVYSDNNAVTMASKELNPALFNKVHNDFGVVFPDEKTPENYITIKNYASFFRVLFNSSYLGRYSSEKALKILSEVDFQDALAAGVPRNIKIAHKFGERGVDKDKQIHDCGIIYYPGHPYLLCVMNRGSNITILTQNIAKISKLIYQEIDKQSK